MPLFLYYVADRTATRITDAMFISTLFAWEFLLDDPSITISLNSIPAGTVIRGFPSAAFDLHTREGRLALSQFHRECGPVRMGLADLTSANRETAVRHCAFIAEGGMLDRQVRFGMGDEIERKAHRTELEFAGLDQGRHSTVLQAVADNLWFLDQLRATVAGRSA
jgi:hypothetical protein